MKETFEQKAKRLAGETVDACWEREIRLLDIYGQKGCGSMTQEPRVMALRPRIIREEDWSRAGDTPVAGGSALSRGEMVTCRSADVPHRYSPDYCDEAKAVTNG